MKKWFKRHKKKIFAVLACVLVVSFSVIPILGAITLHYDNPASSVPSVPTCSDFQSNYLEYTYGNWEDDILLIYEPVADCNITVFSTDSSSYCEVLDVGTELGRNLYNFDSTHNSSIVTSAKFGQYKCTSTFMAGEPGTGDNVPASLFNYYYDVSLKPSSIIDDVLFRFDPFYYAPYSDSTNVWQEDRILEFVIYESDYFSHHTFQISGEFSFVGNANHYSFSYTQGMTYNRQLRVNYRDIILSVFEDDDDYAKALDCYVPIYIEDLTIATTDGEVYYSGAFDFTIQMRCQSIDEYFMYRDNDKLIYDGARAYSDVNTNFEWLVDGVEAFFEAEMFGYISLGGLAFSVIALIFVLGVFKLIKGI